VLAIANPVTAGRSDTQWAQLTRLAGERAALIIEDLRRRVDATEGLIEELYHDAVEKS
jgi:hypothetical protein